MADLKFTTDAPDLTGQRFHRLLVQDYAYSKNKRRYWQCVCDCGRETFVPTKRLTSNHTKSCGCLNQENMDKRRVTPETRRARKARDSQKHRARYPEQTAAAYETYQKPWRADKYLRGLCIGCGKRPQRETSCVCQQCHANSLASVKKRRQACIEKGVCTNCMKNKPEEGRRLCEACRIIKHRTPEQNLERATKKHGLTMEDFNQFLEDQDGVCAICHEFNGGRADRLNIDHCHTTGKVRGLLCHKCNRGIGLFKDSVENLQSAISYLQRHEPWTPFLTSTSMET
jgi:hypothetical protein